MESNRDVFLVGRAPMRSARRKGAHSSIGRGSDAARTARPPSLEQAPPNHLGRRLHPWHPRHRREGAPNMFTGKIAQLTIAGLFAASYLTSNAASAAFTPHVAPSMQSNAQAFSRGVRPDYPPCYGYGSQTYWVEISTSPEVWALEQYGRYCPVKIIWECKGSALMCEMRYWMMNELP